MITFVLYAELARCSSDADCEILAVSPEPYTGAITTTQLHLALHLTVPSSPNTHKLVKGPLPVHVRSKVHALRTDVHLLRTSS